MKRLFVNFMTFAAMATALTFTACSSDSDGDDNGNGNGGNGEGTGSSIVVGENILSGTLTGEQTLDVYKRQMQGHHVMDNVVMKLLIPVCTALRREREQEIKRLAEHNEQFRNELTCYQNSQVNVEIMLKKNVAYKRLFHYDWLRQDIQEYLAKGE